MTRYFLLSPSSVRHQVAFFGSNPSAVVVVVVVQWCNGDAGGGGIKTRNLPSVAIHVAW